MSRPELSVVVPAFDEAAELAGNLTRLVACLEALDRPFEVIVVDDGSRDGTGDVVTGLDDPRVGLVRHAENLGKGRALASGVDRARGRTLVLLDADLEIPPEEIAPVLARFESEAADLALGTKYGADRHDRWPLYRRVLSRAYQAVTQILFRLPLRDTQTGLKVMRTSVARRLVPHLACRQFAWDLEFVLLALETGHRFVSVPVALEPAARASRVGWRGALQAGIDTLRIFIRHRWFARYARAQTPLAPRPTRVLVSGDDLGLSPGVNRGLQAGLEGGGLRSVSILATGATPVAPTGHPGMDRADVGLHLDLLGSRSLLSFAFASLRGPRARWGDALAAQLAALGPWRARISHVDAHRHAWCLPWVRAGVLRRAASLGIPAVRAVAPRGPVFDRGVVEGAKRLLLRALGVWSAGRARAAGLREPDGWVDVSEAARWVAAGRIPRYARGRTTEVIAHPALGAADTPAHEQGTLDRQGDAARLTAPPLVSALESLGAHVIPFDGLARPSTGESACRPT